MPTNQLGYAFAPTFENAEMASRNAAVSGPQDALQVLSYRLPKRPFVRGGLSPLMGDTFRGGPNMSVLESVFKTILGPEAAAAFLGSNGELSTAAMGSQSAPPPSKPGTNITPGGLGGTTTDPSNTEDGRQTQTQTGPDFEDTRVQRPSGLRAIF